MFDSLGRGIWEMRIPKGDFFSVMNWCKERRVLSFPFLTGLFSVSKRTRFVERSYRFKKAEFIFYLMRKAF